MYSQIILQLQNLPKEELNLDILTKIKKERCTANKVNKIPGNASIMREYYRMVSDGQIIANPSIIKVLVKRAVRSQSGIVPVQVLTKPFWCPGKCIFCPNDFTMPKSYINTEPGAQRALMNNFDPYKQAYNRLLSLTMTGHPIDKIEMIVLGGTRDVYPQDYKIRFLKGLYDAANSFDQFLHIYNNGDTKKDFRKFEIGDLNIKYPDSIQESIKINETAECRIIGLTIETRPEYVTDENCIFWRNMGITRVEMGIQSMYDEVLDANKRGHNISQVREAMHRLRSYGFKISCHFMPGLYKSTVIKDIDSFRLAYADIYIKPDEIKFYPTSVIPNTELFDLFISGVYKPLELGDSKYIIEEVLTKYIPPYTRIKRLIRDIPSEEVVAGSSVTNLRQLVETELANKYLSDKDLKIKQYKNLRNNLTIYKTQEEFDKFISQDITNKYSINQSHTNDFSQGILDDEVQTIIIGNGDINIESSREFVSLDTRSREISHAKNAAGKNIFTVLRKYNSSNGVEIFISIEDELGYLYGFGRLCLPNKNGIANVDGLGEGVAIIRELHVYGQLVSVGINIPDSVQHTGIGKYILSISEKIIKAMNFKTLSVISGIGVREYYKKQGYILIGTYMNKNL